MKETTAVMERQPRLGREKQIFIVIGLVPAILFFVLFEFLPIFATVVMSFTNINTFMSNVPHFVGFENYQVAFRDSLTWKVLRNTLAFTIVTVPVGTLLSLVIAMLLNSIGPLRTVFRTIYFAPVVTSMIVVAILWMWMYQPSFGLVNQFLRVFSIPPQRWLINPNTALLSVIIMTIWKNVGYHTVIFMAGLSAISQEYFEAAAIDGANGWQRFRHITVPLLQPTVAFIAITYVIGSLQVFTQPFLLTQGGPFDSTRTMVYLIYTNAFTMDLGAYASALALMLFAIIFAVSMVQVRFFKQRWEY